jgi:hypothetical protein
MLAAAAATGVAGIGGFCGGQGGGDAGELPVATPGGICRRRHQALLVRPDRLAVDPGHPFDLPLAPAGAQQRLYRGLHVWLQDVHSWYSPRC